MSGRISDERLAELIGDDEARCEDFDYDVACLEALKELQQFRALVAELRALAERMRESRRLTAGNRDKYHATNLWLSELDSLLASHTEAKP